MFKSMFILMFSVIAIQFAANAELKNAANQADYIIVSPADFQDALIPFKNWRESKGLKVELVNLEDIYQEFNTSETQTDAIRDFLIYTYNNWQKPAPKYILLAGGITHIPSKKIESEFSEEVDYEDSVSIDEWFITGHDSFQEKTLPLMALGRFPARNVKELNNMIFKTMKFEDDFESFRNKYAITAFSDKKDAETYEQSAETLLKRIGKAMNIKRIYQSEGSQFFGNREALITSMREGTTFLFNFLNANSKIWGSNKDFQASEFDTLVLSENPFILSSISGSQRFDSINTAGIIEKLLVNDTNNAVATFAPAGIIFVFSSTEFLGQLYHEIFNHSDIRFGDAILAIKQNLFDVFGLNNRRFTLLGDPALLIRTDKIADVEPVLPSNGTLAIAPNPASDITNIRFISENSCKAILEVIDVMGRIVISKEYSITSAGNNLGLDLSGLSSGMYLITLKNNGNSINGKLLISK